MKAPETRRGGRYRARERGANDVEDAVPFELPDAAPGVPLGERLSNSSIQVLAGTLQRLGLKLDQEAQA